MTLSRPWYLALLVLLGASSVHAQTVTRRIVPLGVIAGKATEAVVLLERGVEDGKQMGFVQVRVRYRIRSGRTWIETNTLDASESYDSELKIAAHDFTGAGHRQLFVSGTLGRVSSYVFDLSGRRLRLLYTQTKGRIVVRPLPRRSGRYDLEETLSWRDTNAAPGTPSIERRLRWNGRQFALVRPADTPELVALRRVLLRNALAAIQKFMKEGVAYQVARTRYIDVSIGPWRYLYTRSGRFVKSGPARVDTMGIYGVWAEADWNLRESPEVATDLGFINILRREKGRWMIVAQTSGAGYPAEKIRGKKIPQWLIDRSGVDP